MQIELSVYLEQSIVENYKVFFVKKAKPTLRCLFIDAIKTSSHRHKALFILEKLQGTS